MSSQLWAEVKLGFVFNHYAELNRQITGEEYFDDSGPAERYAKAFGLDLTVLPGGPVIFSIEMPFESLEHWGGESTSGTLPLEFFSSDTTKQQLDKLKEKLAATGCEPDEGPVLINIREWT